jgi:ribose/xylose/arabinose/galactoside ABC-type transport system permease subunit
LPFIHFPAVVVWVTVAHRGYGAQSLGNLIEFLLLCGVGGVANYLKVLWIDRQTTHPLVTTIITMIMLMGLALALRTWMPSIPE